MQHRRGVELRARCEVEIIKERVEGERRCGPRIYVICKSEKRMNLYIPEKPKRVWVV